MTLALGGDNLAVWIPLLRADGDRPRLRRRSPSSRRWRLVFLVSALDAPPGIRAFVAWGTKHAPSFLPWLYFGLGVLILIECGSL